jgi:hypothetical protein
MVLAVVAAVAIAFACVLNMRVKGVLREEIARRLPAASHGLGISVEFDDISFNPITGLALDGVSMSSITSGEPSPLMTAKSISLVHSLHLFPEFHVRIDGVRLMRPHVQITIDAKGLTDLQDALAGLLHGGGAVAEHGVGGKLSSPVGDADLPVEVADVLRLVWKHGRLDISDASMGRDGKPNRIGLRNISGNLNYDRRNGDISLTTGARVDGKRGKIDLKADRKAGDYEVALRAEDIGLDGLTAYIPSFAVPRKDAAATL